MVETPRSPAKSHQGRQRRGRVSGLGDSRSPPSGRREPLPAQLRQLTRFIQQGHQQPALQREISLLGVGSLKEEGDPQVHKSTDLHGSQGFSAAAQKLSAQPNTQDPLVTSKSRPDS